MNLRICSTAEVAENFNTLEPGLVKDVLLQHPLPDDLTESQRKQFLSILSHYVDVIARDPDDLGCTRVLQHCIDTKDTSPIRQQARRVPLPRRETVQQLLKEKTFYRCIVQGAKSFRWMHPQQPQTSLLGNQSNLIDEHFVDYQYYDEHLVDYWYYAAM